MSIFELAVPGSQAKAILMNAGTVEYGIWLPHQLVAVKPISRAQ